MDKKFLTIKEICEYTGWGETKVSAMNKAITNMRKGEKNETN